MACEAEYAAYQTAQGQRALAAQNLAGATVALNAAQANYDAALAAYNAAVSTENAAAAALLACLQGGGGGQGMSRGADAGPEAARFDKLVEAVRRLAEAVQQLIPKADA